MDDKEIFDKIIKILGPFAKDKDALGTANNETNMLKDLKINSSRLVDIVLGFEDEFDIEVDDSEADQVRTIGAAVNLIKSKV